MIPETSRISYHIKVCEVECFTSLRFEDSCIFSLGQSTDLVSMVYSCIGAEIEDSDASSTCDFKATDQDTDRSTTISDAPTDTRTNGHVASSKQQTDRQMETGRQERIVPLTDARTELDDNRQSGIVAPSGPRPEPPPQSTKPSLSVMRQRHLQECLGTATEVVLKGSVHHCLINSDTMI